MSYNRGLNGFGSWFRSHWRRIAGAAAIAVAGPLIGGIIAGILEALPKGGDKSSLSQFSPRVETALDLWAKNKFDAWFLNKIKMFKSKTTLASLLDASTISQINRAIVEMASYIKYYEYMATQKGDAELYAAKAVVMQDALTEFAEIYETGVTSLRGIVYVARTNSKTITVTGGPDVMQWSGKSYMITVPSFSRKPQTVSTLPTSGNMTLPPVITDVKPNDPTPPLVDVIQIKPFIRPVVEGVPLPTRPQDTAYNCLVPPCDQNKPAVMTIKPNQKPAGQGSGSMSANSDISNQNQETPKKSNSKFLKIAATVVVAGVVIKSLT